MRFGRRWLLSPAISALCLLLLLLSCKEQAPRQMQGVLIDVQSRSLTDAVSITVRDSKGTIHVFRVSPQVAADPQHPATASHLREHMTLGLPVHVAYEQEADGLTAVQVADRLPDH